jgi:ectoine hydroxylase-related dioxygenase (phytanoyl-CoA dioxygenase family)
MATHHHNKNTKHELLERGFIKLDSVFSNEEMDELRLKSEAVLFRTNSQHRDRFKSTGSMCNLMELPEYASLLSDPRLIQALTQTGGNDIRWTAGFLISKPPGGAPLFWHQDWWGWDSPVSYQPQPTQLFVMIYLTDTRVENGCLRVIPGSHRQQHPLHFLPPAHSKDIATQIDENSPTYASHPDEVAVPVSKGDVIIGDSRLLHSAYANKTEEERPLLTLWYIPNWSSLPADIQTTLYDIYSRKVADVDDVNGNAMTCEDWPTYAVDKIKGIKPSKPNKPNDVKALPWNRSPTTDLLAR